MSGSTAPKQRNIEFSCDREVRSSTAPSPSKGQAASGRDGHRGPHWHTVAIDGRRQVRARYRDDRGLVEKCLWPHQSDFEGSRRVLILDQTIGDDERKPVHGTADRDAIVLVAVTSEILDRRTPSGLDDPDTGRFNGRHDWVPPLRSSYAQVHDESSALARAPLGYRCVDTDFGWTPESGSPQPS